MPRWLRFVLLAGFASALLVLIWSAAVEPRLITEERYEVDIPDLPPEWGGKRVALIADPQVGLWLSNAGTVRRIVARLVKMKPAAVLIAGDFVYQSMPDETGSASDAAHERDAAQKDVSEIERLLRPLTSAGVPTFAVLGNHDFPLNAPQRSRLPGLETQVREALAATGIRVLADEAVRLPSPRRSASGDDASDLWLVGLSARAAHRDRSAAAFAKLPIRAPRLVLMHNPKTFRQVPADAAPLAMAGHTHGGQIRFPFLLLRRLFGKVNCGPPPISGWMDDYGQPGNRLYINRGIGFSRLPLRFNAPPEITLFTLRRAASQLA